METFFYVKDRRKKVVRNLIADVDEGKLHLQSAGSVDLYIGHDADGYNLHATALYTEMPSELEQYGVNMVKIMDTVQAGGAKPGIYEDGPARGIVSDAGKSLNIVVTAPTFDEAFALYSKIRSGSEPAVAWLVPDPTGIHTLSSLMEQVEQARRDAEFERMLSSDYDGFGFDDDLSELDEFSLDD